MSKKGYLIAVTPRAGRWNGCLIVPEGSDIDEKIAAKYAELATRKQGDKKYLAVSRIVSQETTGRMAPEWLIFINPGISPRDGDRRLALKKSMTARLEDLGRLVNEGICWDDHRQPTMIRRPELNSWSETLQPQCGNPGQRMLALAMRHHWLTFLLVIMIGIAMMVGNQQGESRKLGWLKKFMYFQSSKESIKTVKPSAAIKIEDLEAWENQIFPQDKNAPNETIVGRVKKLKDRLENILLIDVNLPSDIEPETRLEEILYRLTEEEQSQNEAIGKSSKSANDGIEELLSNIDLRGKVADLSRILKVKPSAKDLFYETFGVKSKPESFPEMEISTFRSIMGKASKVLIELRKLGVPPKQPKNILDAIHLGFVGSGLYLKSEIDPFAHASDKEYKWRFYVPSDIYAYQELGNMLGCLVTGLNKTRKGPNLIDEVSDSPNQPGRDPRSTQIAFIGYQKLIEDAKSYDAIRMSAFSSLLELADEIKRFVEPEN